MTRSKSRTTGSISSDPLHASAQERVVESARRFAVRFAIAVKALKTYPPTHPSHEFSHRGIASALTDLYEIRGAADLGMELDGVEIGELRANLDPAQNSNLHDLHAWLRRRDTQIVRVTNVVTPAQVQRFFSAAVDFGDELSPVEAREVINASLAEAGIGHIVLDTHRVRRGASQRSSDPAQRLLDAYLDLCGLLADLEANGVRSGTLLAVMEACETMVAELGEQAHAVSGLLQVGQQMPYESRHGANLVVLAIGIGARLGLKDAPLVDLAQAVATMDVGMEVLNRDARRAGRELRPQEWVTLRGHPLESARVHLRDRDINHGTRRRMIVALEHHLGIARDGYPSLELWPALHLFSRIAAVCDAYDAFTSTTSWRQGLSPSKALAELLPPLDRAHDPVIVAELCALIGHYPPQCSVRLSTGQLATIDDERGPSGLPLVRLGPGPDEGQQVDLGDRDDAGALVRTVAEVRVVPDEAQAG